MGLPVLQRGEQWLVQSRDVTVRKIPFHAYLTNRRVILTSPYDPLMPDKDLNLDRIEGIEGSANDTGEPVLIIGAHTSCSGSRRLILTFSEHPGNPTRVGEREEWIRHLTHVLKNPAKPEVPGPVTRAPPKNEDPPARYDPGKLVFSPGLCDAGDLSSKKKEVHLEIRGVPQSDHVRSFPPGMPGPSPEMHRPPPPVSLSPDRFRQPPSPPQDIPRTVRPMASSDDGSFFCTTCGSRVPPGSRYCDRCGAKVIPPDPDLAGSSRDSLTPPVNRNSSPESVRTQNLQIIDNGSRNASREQITVPYHALPPRGAVTKRVDTGCTHPGASREPSLSGQFGKNSRTGVGHGKARTANRWMLPISQRSRSVHSLAVIVMIVCIAAGLFALVSPVGFARTMGTIIPVGITGNGAGSSAATLASMSGQDAVSPVFEDGIFLRIVYTGSWSGSYGMTDEMQTVKGNGEKILPVEIDGDSVSATIKKDDASSDKLIVELYQNGEKIATGHTTEPGSSVMIAGSI